MPCRAACEDEAGFALVAVLWFLVLVAAVAAPFAIAARTDFLIASNRLQAMRLDMLAGSVSTLLSLRLVGRNDAAAPLADMPRDSSPVSCVVGDHAFVIRVQDQSGLIDLNAAESALLAVGLDTLGIAQAARDTLAEAIVDYRNVASPPADRRQTVAIEGGPKRGPFETVVELADFEPLKDVEPARLHRAFTVHSGLGIVAASLAPPDLAGRLKRFSGTPGGDVGGSAQAFAVEITVSEGRAGGRGYAGFLIQPSDAPDAPFRRVEQLLQPGFEAGGGGPGRSCPASLRNDIAALLAGGRG